MAICSLLLCGCGSWLVKLNLFLLLPAACCLLGGARAAGAGGVAVWLPRGQL
jgi:hypothetical protein